MSTRQCNYNSNPPTHPGVPTHILARVTPSLFLSPHCRHLCCPALPTNIHAVRCTGHAGDRSAARRGAAYQRRAAAAALPSVPVEAGLNLFMARIGFDLLRSAVVKEHLQAHIQRKLNVLRIPEYISSLEVRPLTCRMLKVLFLKPACRVSIFEHH